MILRRGIPLKRLPKSWKKIRSDLLASQKIKSSHMKIWVTAKPNAQEEKVEEISSAYFRVSVNEPPKGGRANDAILQALATHFGVPRTRACLIVGFTSRKKIIEITLKDPHAS